MHWCLYRSIDFFLIYLRHEHYTRVVNYCLIHYEVLSSNFYSRHFFINYVYNVLSTFLSTIIRLYPSLFMYTFNNEIFYIKIFFYDSVYSNYKVFLILLYNYPLYNYLY